MALPPPPTGGLGPAIPYHPGLMGGMLAGIGPNMPGAGYIPGMLAGVGGGLPSGWAPPGFGVGPALPHPIISDTFGPRPLPMPPGGAGGFRDRVMGDIRGGWPGINFPNLIRGRQLPNTPFPQRGRLPTLSASGLAGTPYKRRGPWRM